MDRRLKLQSDLVELLDSDFVYFQPPENTKIKYPCIMYERNYIESQFADNRPYRLSRRYQVTVIDRNPDSEIPDKVAALPLCVFDRYFVSDNLHHHVFKLFF